MNGAEALLKSLIDSGVEVCFANPGTSEMQLVAAIDEVPGMRPILGLFEGVVTGAADGYGRMADKPAATLLHLGSGLANGLANLHNAKRAFTPIVNIIGDHATYHLAFDAPLTSDLPAYASLTTDWMKVSNDASHLAQDGVEAVAASMEGRHANLIVPADLAWTDDCEAAAPVEPSRKSMVPEKKIADIAARLKGKEPACLFLGGLALREQGLVAAKRIAKETGARLISEVFPARLQRGKGRPTIERLPYLGEMAADSLAGLKQMVTVGAKAPVSFFAYPGKPGTLWPEECDVTELARQGDDQIAALEALADFLDAQEWEPEDDPALPPINHGALNAESVGAIIANKLPANAIVSDESNTSGAMFYTHFDGAEPHDWLSLTGGAIGQGLPVALGAAVACPQQKVVNLQSDGSAMYTNQSMWTMAREELDVCIVLLNNSSYAILNLELMRVGVANPGPGAKSMLSLTNPTLNWVKLAEGMGVKAGRATTTQEFEALFDEAMATKGPRLIEAMI